jgi:2-pyrone-4,6-dicarboxylate lactonase
MNARSSSVEISGACDCHVHVIGSPEHYPMLRQRTYTPPQATVEDLRVHLSRLHLSRVVLVQPSFYGTDNRCLLDALRELGPMARGVAVVDASTSRSTLSTLAKHGVRGVRVNLESGGQRDRASVRRAVARFGSAARDCGWHIQIFASLQTIESAAADIAALDVPVVLDHFAMARVSAGASDPANMAGVDMVIDLLRAGSVYVKLSAPYRVSEDAPDYALLAPLARAFIDANLARVLWASDWPHTNRLAGMSTLQITPFRVVDDCHSIKLLKDWVDDSTQLRAILADNPERLYGF